MIDRCHNTTLISVFSIFVDIFYVSFKCFTISLLLPVMCGVAVHSICYFEIGIEISHGNYFRSIPLYFKQESDCFRTVRLFPDSISYAY